ncbi:MAG: A/G-specific adenine glycosylase [Tissierella sp.]|nr:A/G-specific adenine glycosylase [Tissierella sp.]
MDIITLIKEFTPRTDLQQNSKDGILNQLNQYGEKLYDRDMLHGHMTASAIILNPQLDKILMVHHNIYDSYAWPGGHSDGEEDLYRVAYEEAKEETGVEKLYPISRNIISMESLPVKEHMKNGKQVKAHDHYNVTFGFICSEKEQLKIKPDENKSVNWIDIEKLDQYCEEEEMIPIYQDNIHHIQYLMKEKRKNYEKLPERLLHWYKKNARQLPWRRDQDPYHIWLSEIMLQQTRVDTVIDYYHRFLEVFPTIYDLANADIERVLKLWEGLGYYSRARNLHKTAKIILERYEGKFPRNYKELLTLPGIGSYTAGAIGSISFNLPVAAVDGNVLRVISRITEDYRCIDHESIKKEIGENLEEVYPKDQCGDFTQSLMELGATICLPNGVPLCHQCPVKDICMANKNGTQEFLPVRKKKTARKEQQKTIFVFNVQGKIALQRREEKCVLEGMWELPNVEGILEKREVSSYMEQLGIFRYRIEKSKKGQHIFTHIKWEMVCYYIQCEETFGAYIWADTEALEKEYSIPTAFKKFLNSK